MAHSFWRESFAGGVAGCGACLVSNPLDMLKARYQVQGELNLSSQEPYKRILRSLLDIGRYEGWRALQKGLGPALVYNTVSCCLPRPCLSPTACYLECCPPPPLFTASLPPKVLNGSRFALYDGLTSAFQGGMQGLQGRTGQNRPGGSWATIPAAMGAGAISGALASPLAVVKIRMQTQSLVEEMQVGFFLCLPLPLCLSTWYHPELLFTRSECSTRRTPLAPAYEAWTKAY